MVAPFALEVHVLVKSLPALTEPPPLPIVIGIEVEYSGHVPDADL